VRVRFLFSFGEHTAGFSTANDTHQFLDGAGKLYPNALDPDETILGEETRPDEANDAALIAAEQWLGRLLTHVSDHQFADLWLLRDRWPYCSVL
jgi:hypothetical protein